MIISILAVMAIAADDATNRAPKRAASRDKMVCEEYTVPGSRFTKRRCLKASARERISDAAIEGFQALQNSVKINPAERP